MVGMVEKGHSTYAVDFRVNGRPSRDSNEWTFPIITPNDIPNVLSWISAENNKKKMPLFGWSMGSTLSFLSTQKK
jgi:predicted alpha/beta-fold hydrolase